MLALAGCTYVAPGVHFKRPKPPDPRTQMTALEARIYALVEQERAKIDPKAKPLVLDPELVAVARARSQDMAAKHYMAHRSPSGQTSASIIMARDADFQGLLGENIAAQYYTREGGVDVDTYARRFVETWLKSKSHRDNLAFPDYDRTGVGAAVNGDTVYVTQLFSAQMADGPASSRAGGGKAKDGRTVSLFADPADAKASKPPRRDVQLRRSTGEATLPGK